MNEDPLRPTTSSAPTSETALPPEVAALLKRTPDGLVPAVVQDATTGQVLMMAWMNDRALAATLQTRRGTYFSRSRDKLWVKGEQSGHTQRVREVRLDCDGDTLLLSVDQSGPACHTGLQSCFDSHRLLSDDDSAGPRNEPGDEAAAGGDAAGTGTPLAEGNL